jgi:hypothetical protein
MSNVIFLCVGGLIAAGSADAAPVIREAVATDAIGIQATVDQFRADCGNPDNGITAGSQPGGRRQIGWDGNPTGPPTLSVPGPMLNFINRGTTFFTPGVGLEISGEVPGAPTSTARFAEINPAYFTQFGVFSPPRLFAALNSNIVDVVFHVPGDSTVAAATNGFGAVFTDVDSAVTTKMEFYAPDGTLLFEKTVLAGAGDAYLSFLGVSFNAGELIGRVRITSGNAALGPVEAGTLDLVVMDDFIFGEPVPTAGLSIVPESGRLFRTGGFDLVIGAQNLPAGVVGGSVKLDGFDVTSAFLACLTPGTITGGGQTFRCVFPRNFLAPGDHVVQVELTLANQTRVRNAVRWTIIGSTEP